MLVADLVRWIFIFDRVSGSYCLERMGWMTSEKKMAACWWPDPMERMMWISRVEGAKVELDDGVGRSSMSTIRGG